MSRWLFHYVGFMGLVRIVDVWHGGYSEAMITDDFGNGIELGELPIDQWNVTLAN